MVVAGAAETNDVAHSSSRRRVAPASLSSHREVELASAWASNQACANAVPSATANAEDPGQAEAEGPGQAETGSEIGAVLKDTAGSNEGTDVEARSVRATDSQKVKLPKLVP